MTPASNQPSALRWAAIPVALVLLALVGLAAGTESRDDFEDRNRQETEQSDDSTQDDSDRQPSDDPGQRESEERNFEQSGSPEDQDSPTEEGEGSERVTIQTGDGEVVVELDENGNPVRVVSGDDAESSPQGRVFRPDADGGIVGVRVSDDGRLEPVERDDLQTDDFLIRPGSNGGIDLTRPDGTRLQLEPQPDGELDATSIALDGTAQDEVVEGGDVIVQPTTGLAPDLEVDPATEPIVVETSTGPVRLDLDPEQGIVADQPGDGTGITIEPEDEVAIRIDENGQPELVPVEGIGEDDTVLVPTGDGFDLVRPDGTRVEFRPDGENDGVTATQIDPDGEETELTPNPDGSVTLDDGTTVGPIDIAEDGGVIEEIIDQTSELPWPWVFGAIAAIALLSIGTAVHLHRNRPEDAFDYTQLATSGVPADRFEEFVTMLLADSDPSRSIRLAFYAAERGLGGLPRRRRDETPSEWHRRVEETTPHLAEPLGPICDLFARARFAPGQATTDDRDAMVRAIRDLHRVADRNDLTRDLTSV